MAMNAISGEPADRAAYRPLSLTGLPAYLASVPALAARLGGGPDDWRCRDVADGNLNSVFLVDGPAGSFCVKQALPYVRVAGESWPLDIHRALFEYRYGVRLAPHVGALAPRLFHYDEDLFVIVMEKLEPHIILRKALVAGRHFPKAATDVADYVAAASFHTSDLAGPFETKFADLELFSRNRELQRISVDLIFTDPYREVWRNKIIAPLQGWGEALRGDIDLKAAVARARLAYLGKAQSLIHGDLHSGSVMVTADETRVIDGEFAWVGPSGFDVGNFLAHYAMVWFAKPFHPGDAAEHAAFRTLIEGDIVDFWQRFETRFLDIWRACETEADGFPRSHFDDPPAAARLETLRRGYVADIFRDAVAFLALKTIRRIVGYAQIADFLAIEDIDRRALAMAGALAFARSLLLHPDRYTDVAAVVAALHRFETAGLDPAATRPF